MLFINAFRFAIRINSIHLTNWFESIRFPKKSYCSIRPQLAGVCMQSFPILCQYSPWFIIQSAPPLNGLQLTWACIVNTVTVTYHNFNITVFLAYIYWFCCSTTVTVSLLVQEAQLLLWQPIVLHAGVRLAKTTTAWYLFYAIHCDRSISTCE